MDSRQEDGLPPVIAPGAHLRLDHRQDQLDRPDATDHARLVDRVRHRVQPGHGAFRSIGYLLIKGVGIWGINVPVAWGFAIVNFVWWIGIGHAGTLISAILLLLRQKWRTSHQPLRRGDDALRGRLRRPVSAAAPGPAVVLLLAVPLPQHDGPVAAVPQPAGLGRLRRLDLLRRSRCCSGTSA